MLTTCATCNEFASERVFRSEHAAEFQRFHEALALAIATGRLVIEVGSLQWDDCIDCLVRCPTCQRQFQLEVETYHGSGGTWRKFSAGGNLP